MKPDKNIVRLCAQQVVKTKGIEARRQLIKDLASQYGGREKSAFESSLKDEVERMWIGRKG